MRTCYRFGPFTVSPTRRALLRGGDEVPLIPRYFDLLVLLLERRGEAVHRRDIRDAVWSDVVVSDGALSQAVRTLRRALGDDSREPAYIRTVSRHGYRFVFEDVVEDEDAALPAAAAMPAAPPPDPPGAGGLGAQPRSGVSPQGSRAGIHFRREPPDDPFEPALQALLAPADDDDGDGRRAAAETLHALGTAEALPTAAAMPAAPPPDPPGANPFEPALQALLAPVDDDDGDGRRAAAETLHALGTAEALRRLDRHPGHARGRALLRDARWDVPGAGEVPLLGQPGWPASALHLALLRLRRAAREVAARWAAASLGGALAGVFAGLLGALLLMTAPDSHAPSTLPVVLAFVGTLVGGIGAAGVGAGLAAAEALARSSRALALVALGALAGGATGFVASTLARLVLAGLFGHALPRVGGGLEGVVLGAAAGLGYALATPRPAGGMATPHGAERLRAALAAAVCCALAGLGLTALGGQLTGASLNALGRAFQGSQVTLEPLARRLGEREMGPTTRAVLAVGEGALFGAGLILGLTRRPR